MKKRGLIISVLVLLAVITSGFTYAWWASTIDDNGQSVPGTVVIGEGGSTTLTANLDDVDSIGLVPSAYTGDDTAVLSFLVEWNEDIADTAGGSGTLAVVVESYTLGTLDETQIDAMFDIDVTLGNNAAISVEGGLVTVEVTVVFHTEPANQTIYNQVANGNLQITLSFTVNPLP